MEIIVASEENSATADKSQVTWSRILGYSTHVSNKSNIMPKMQLQGIAIAFYFSMLASAF